jgi:transcriptional regulator with XRE-family HTH domain
MTWFDELTNQHEHAATLFVGRVRHELLKALDEEAVKTRLNQSKIADELGINRSVISRQLNGQSDMTLSRVAELASVMGRRAELRLPEIRAATAIPKFETTASRSGMDETPNVRWNVGVR